MSKKIFLTVLVLVVLALFVSCNASIKMVDEEGWEIFQCGWALNENEVLIQSHDGYVLDERFYTEHIDTIEPIIEENEVVIYEGKSVLIENRLGNPIDVKLTYNSVVKWVEINANESYLIEVACFQ
jgi:hypothetical protein